MRIAKLKENLLACQPVIYVERARLVTQSYKETEGQPVIIRRAKALAKVLREMTICIGEDELIVGNRSPYPRMGVVSPEMAVEWIDEELDVLPTRPQDRFIISEEDKRELREEIFPYWRGKTLYDFVMATMPTDTKEALGARVFTLAQTDKGQGHILPDYAKVLEHGLVGLRSEVERKLRKLSRDQRSRPPGLFYQAALISLDAAIEFGGRYAQEGRRLASSERRLSRKAELERMAEICGRVPAYPARSFHEALQSIWLLQVILQCESNASSISPGRIDQYIYPYYAKDIAEGRITPEEARELLECLWIKYNEIVQLRSAESARYFAGFPIGHNIVLGGQTADGREATNELSYLCLRATADLCLPQPNLGIRLHSTTPESFLREACRVIRLGIGMPQVFNDEAIIPALLNRGISLYDARNYAAVGCVELSVPGKMYGLHDIAMFSLIKALELALNDGKDPLEGRQIGPATGDPLKFKEYADLEEAFGRQIQHFVKHMVVGANVVDRAHATVAPTSLLSCLIDDCIEKGLDVTAGGAHYNASGVQGVGIANVADSLAAIRKLVFEEGKVSMRGLKEALAADFEGWETLRQMLFNHAPKYGNDIDSVDLLAKQWATYYCREVERYSNPRGGRFQPGHYTVSAHVPLGAAVGATPDGRRARQPLADGGLSPMRGVDVRGPTAVLKSACKVDQVLASNGTLLNLKFLPSTLEGEEGLRRLSGLLRTFADLKGLHVQFNVISADILRAAQLHPEEYRNLVIRVAGYSAYFTELDKELQDEIIARTEHVL